MKNRIFNIAKLVISVGLLAYLFQMFDLAQSWNALRSMDLRYFAIALLLFSLSLVIRSFRWRVLLEAVDVHVPQHRLIYLYFAGVFFNTFLPSGFGGDAIKMYELARYSNRGSESVGTVLVDRLVGIVILFITGLMVLPFAYHQLPRQEAIILLVASVGGLVATWVLFQRKLAEWIIGITPRFARAKLQGLYDAVHTCGTGAMWKALAISGLFSLTLFGQNYFLALALGATVPFKYIVAFMPVLSLAMLIPSVGALGTREGAYVLLFGAAGVSEPVAIAISLSFYLCNVLNGLVGAVFYAIEAARGLRPPKPS